MRALRSTAVRLGRTCRGLTPAAAGALVLLAARPRLVPLRAAAPDEAVVTAVAAAGWLCVAWLTLGALLVALGRLPGAVGGLAGRLGAAITPVALRRIVEAAVGVAVATSAAGVALPAAADTGRPAVVAVADGAPASRGSGVPLAEPPLSLDRPVADPVPRVALVSAAPRPAAGPDGEVVVRPGDTLWGLAARHLGPGCGTAQVAAAWPEWYAANRAVIGADPDLIRPGQRLRPPR